MEETANDVQIYEISDVGKLCRVCLTESKVMVPLSDPSELEQNNLWAILQKTLNVTLPRDKQYPSCICPMCLSLLKISYNFKTRFEDSQKLLSQYYGECLLYPEDLKSILELVYENEGTEVELISKQGKYNLKDIVVVEKNLHEEPNYSGFLNSLGKEVSATFVNNKKDNLRKGVSTTIVSNKNSISLEKKSSTFGNIQSRNIRTTASTPSVNNEPISNPNFNTTIPVNNKPTVNPDMNIANVQENSDNESEEDQPLAPDLFDCSYCGKVFRTRKYLTRHVDNMHLRNNETYICEVCGISRTSRAAIKSHVYRHYQKEHHCDMCDKTYFNRTALRLHIMSVHRNERPHLCTVCGKSFNYANALQYHMRLHTGEKKYHCQYCDRKFTMQCGLNRHTRTHTGLRPYKCKFCEKAFRSKGEVDCHEMTHTGYRPYHCKYCKKGFTKQFNLNLHYLSHPGDHGCELCNKTFIDVQYLKTHMKAAHCNQN